MIVIDENLLASMRLPGRCECCGKPCNRREPHHLWARGLGGGHRLDVAINLIALGSTLSFQCNCHTLVHTGQISRERLLGIVAAREKMTVAALEAEIHRLRRVSRKDIETAEPI